MLHRPAELLVGALLPLDFRRRFQDRTMALEAVHLFRSRAEAFKTDGVLRWRTCIILMPPRGDRGRPSANHGVKRRRRSPGRQLPARAVRRRIVDPDTRDAWLYLPESRADLRALTTVERQPHLLADLGWAFISTGPIVAFRATEHLRTVACDSDRGGRSDALACNTSSPAHVEWTSLRKTAFRKPQWLSAEAPSKLRVPEHPNCVLHPSLGIRQGRPAPPDRRAAPAPVNCPATSWASRTTSTSHLRRRT